MNRKTMPYVLSCGLIGLSAVAAEVENPILPGFYPDPSLCRVNGDYYLVTSSFGFFPGVPIFHSRDLIHWEQLGHVLDRPSQLDLTKEPIWNGIWAPSIRYHNGTFYLITTKTGNYKKNFYVTATDPSGPWSEPVWLPELNGGIDPSFFFDTDGKAYIINNRLPPEDPPLYPGHRALWLQEYDLAAKKLRGEPVMLVNGGADRSTKPIWIEGPHIFNEKGYYYLLAAEGGTGPTHAEVIFLSKSIWGPYEVFKGVPILTQRDLPDDRPDPVTCTGHADMVKTANGEWVSIFLACQPYTTNGHFNTGRQTFFHPVDWSGEWPIILEKGKPVPLSVASPLPPETGKTTFAEASTNWRDDFDGSKLKLEWNFIRTPKTTWHRLANGALEIDARPIPMTTVGNPSFIGRRLQHASASFSTALTLEKGKTMEAGIVAYQNEKFFYKLVMERTNACEHLVLSSATAELARVELKGHDAERPVYLRMKADKADFSCEYSLDNQQWSAIGAVLDGKQLSTTVAGGYIGAYLGLYAFADTPATARFDWATYQKQK